MLTVMFCARLMFISSDAQESDAKLKKKKRAEKKKQQADSLEDVLERLRPGCKIRLAVQEIDQDKMLVAPAGENSDKFHGVVHITGAIDRVSVTSEPGMLAANRLRLPSELDCLTPTRTHVYFAPQASPRARSPNTKWATWSAARC